MSGTYSEGLCYSVNGNVYTCILQLYINSFITVYNMLQKVQLTFWTDPCIVTFKR